MTLRRITSHQVSPADRLEIFVSDDPGPGGANHRYEVAGWSPGQNPSYYPGQDGHLSKLLVLFQNGTLPERGTNGVTIEALLAICIDRLQSFQAGPFANNYNARALDGCLEAIEALKSRTRDRIARDVEGKHEA